MTGRNAPVLDLVNTVLVFAGLGVLVWIGWTANRTILNLNRPRTKDEAFGDWLALLPGPALLVVIGVLLVVINRLASGR